MSGFQVITENIAAHATKHEVERLLCHWETLHARLGRIPTYAEFNINAFQDCIGNIMVMLPVDDDYFYMNFGAAIARDAGFDMTGKRLTDFSKHLGVKFKECYDACIRTRRPALTLHTAAYKVSVHSWERLILLVSGAAEDDLMLIVYNSPRENKYDIIDAILQASTNGILAITPVFDDDGQICDGVVIAANKAVEAIVGVPVEKLADTRLLETFPGLLENGVWDRYLTVFETGESDQFEVAFDIDGEERVFQVGVAAFIGGVTVTFADVGALVRANQSLQQQRLQMLKSNQALEAQAKQLAALAAKLESSQTTLNEEMKLREKLEEELRLIANTDELTGIPNLRSFSACSKRELIRAARYQHVVSVIVFDVDRFKNFNDTYGHAVGDQVLRMVGRRIGECMRESIDVYGRIGGEEFAILLPETGSDGAYNAADRLRRNIEESYIGINGDLVRVTASFGVATWAGYDESLQGVLHRADAALYSAKRLGRNRVEVDHSMMSGDDDVIGVEREE